MVNQLPEERAILVLGHSHTTAIQVPFPSQNRVQLQIASRRSPCYVRLTEAHPVFREAVRPANLGGSVESCSRAPPEMCDLSANLSRYTSESDVNTQRSRHLGNQPAKPGRVDAAGSLEWYRWRFSAIAIGSCLDELLDASPSQIAFQIFMHPSETGSRTSCQGSCRDLDLCRQATKLTS
jgi:hypothetical protein